MATIHQAIDIYLDTVGQSRSARTEHTYRNGLNRFQEALRMANVPTLFEDRVAVF